MGKIWLTSDWHLHHDKDFILQPRGFSSAEEMNQEILERHNSLVDDNDIYAGENIICHVEVEDTRIVAHYYMEKIKLLRKNAKAMILVPGLRAYYNIYFNLYQNKEYYKIEEYYQTIKK